MSAVDNAVQFPITQEELDNLLFSLPAGASFAQALLARGYATVLENVTLHQQESKALYFSDCVFKNVTIEGQFQNTVFTHASFYNTTFSHVDLRQSAFHDTTFQAVNWFDSNFQASSFSNVDLNGVFAKNSDLSASHFHESTFTKGLFSNTTLKDVTGVENQVQGLHIVFDQAYQPSDMFHGAAQFHIKPTVLMVNDALWFAGPNEAILDLGGQPLPVINTQIDHEALSLQVKLALQSVDLTSQESIGQQVIHANQPLIQEIYQYAKALMHNVDSLLLPGGPDLHPEFYGEENTQSQPDATYYREILEMSLIENAIQMDKPILGICHGSQMINVFLGGTLHQDVEGHQNVDLPLTKLTQQGLIGAVIQEHSLAPSMHHQAVNKIAPTLEVVATAKGVVKATQAIDGKKIMATQYHPEDLIDKSSINILKQFMSLSSEKKVKAMTDIVGDLLGFGDGKTIHSLLGVNVHAKPVAPEAEPAFENTQHALPEPVLYHNQTICPILDPMLPAQAWV